MSEGELLGAAFTAFHDAHRVNFLKYARARGLSFHDAEDVVNDAFVQLYRNRERLANSDNPAALGFKVVRDAVADHCRRQDRQPVPTAAVDDRPGPDEVTAVVTRVDLERAIDQLPQRRADCMRLHAFLDQDARAIADYLEISVSAVRTHLYLARRHLAKRFTKEGGRRGL
ncbi:RNA polymerase sigma factor [Saccharopolyspora taberi]|uniref:Uncharacterized protein n=1 Tax=Saccharopolyspora taberi TaxID=60895 RepID=A0ABN3VKU7_9PSEU